MDSSIFNGGDVDLCYLPNYQKKMKVYKIYQCIQFDGTNHDAIINFMKSIINDFSIADYDTIHKTFFISPASNPIFDYGQFYKMFITNWLVYSEAKN